MFMLRDILTAHFAAWAGRMDILDDVWLPKWLDRRVRWTEVRDRRRFLRAERMHEHEPAGKDATKDW
ncbi:MAG: hypothetical protein R6W93_05570 [Candidatus Limnocylindrales bacterium]|jgi:hypothetical protein